MQTTQQNNEARTAIESGFAWDAQDAYLFDIDGTLLRSRDRVHMDSLPASVRAVMGIEVSLEGVSLAGNTDTSILREACALWRADRDPVTPPGAETLGAARDRAAAFFADVGSLPGTTLAATHGSLTRVLVAAVVLGADPAAHRRMWLENGHWVVVEHAERPRLVAFNMGPNGDTGPSHARPAGAH